MHLHTRNVNTAFQRLVGYFDDQRDALRDAPIVKKPSRNGNVMMIDEPVMVTYSHPQERVLFNSARNANPFLHLYEALWMLAGRNDVAPLAYYASKMKDFSDDGKTFNGAYGYRWRQQMAAVGGNWPGKLNRVPHDQLNILVNHLKADPNSRRAVLQMWNVEDDLLKIGLKCGKCDDGKVRDNIATYRCLSCCPASKDVCCNLSVMFSLRNVSTDIEAAGHIDVLDMTVTNRSNDMIWGMLGADYVHFTFLQEYMAARLGIKVGKYNHFTNNLHVYDWNWKPKEWLGWEPDPRFTDPDLYRMANVRNFVPLVKDPATFERELPVIVSIFDGTRENDRGGCPTPSEPFLKDVAWPMLSAHYAYKHSTRTETPIDVRLNALSTAFEFCTQIKSDDWRLAATDWLNRRKK